MATTYPELDVDIEDPPLSHKAQRRLYGAPGFVTVLLSAHAAWNAASASEQWNVGEVERAMANALVNAGWTLVPPEGAPIRKGC